MREKSQNFVFIDFINQKNYHCNMLKFSKISKMMLFSLVMLFCILMPSLLKAQNSCSNSLDPQDAGQNIGIHTTDPDKSLHILSRYNTGSYLSRCREATIKLEHNNINPAITAYSTYITLLNPYTFENPGTYDFTQIPTRTYKDFVISSDLKSRSIIMTTRDYEGLGHIRFATTPASSNIDYERLTISPIGNIGIGNDNPQELVHIKNLFTIFSEDKDDEFSREYSLIARNIYHKDGKKSYLTEGSAASIEFTKEGEIYLIAAGEGYADDEVSYLDANDDLRGIHIKNTSGKVYTGIGCPANDNSRLLIKGTSTSNLHYALKIMNSAESTIFVARNNGWVGIGNSAPKDILQIGNEILFTHGGTNFPKYFDINGYYNGTTNVNVVAGPSLRIGTDGNNYQKSAYIMIDYKATAGSEIYTVDEEVGWDDDNGKFFKGIKLMNDGKIGMGIWEPYSALTVRSKGSITSTTTSAFDVRNTDDDPLFIVRDDGSIGIGTTSPSSKLEILGQGSEGLTTTLNILNSNNSSIFSILDDGEINVSGGIKNSIAGEPVKILGQGSEGITTTLSILNSNNSSIFKVKDNGELQIVSLKSINSGEPIKIEKLFVGVGTPDPAFLFSVNGNTKIDGVADISGNLKVHGTIYTTEVLVNDPVNWPDYVFEKEYKLNSLAETAEYIEKNGHLPDVPSKESIDKDGLKLVEMQVILLKKIEELTLHLIELKKDNDLLKKELDSIKQSK